MTKAIVQRRYGGAEVLEYGDVDVGRPGPGEVRLRHTAIGVNFHDIYVRDGSYQTLALPGTPGIEAVGEIVAVGEGVPPSRVGQRVAYVDKTYGAYSDERLIPEHLLMMTPEGIADEVVAGALVRGMTAAVLLQKIYPLQAGQWSLVHAATGGMGRLLCAWAKHIGAHVVGTVGSDDKMKIAEEHCDAVFLHSDPDWPAKAVAVSGGGFDYVCDSIGAPTFSGSIAAVSKRGHIALFGQSGGAVDCIKPDVLASKSLTVSRPIVFHYCEEAAARTALAASFFELVGRRIIVLDRPEVFSLEHAAEAHRRLESRRLGGPLVLKPHI